MLGGAAQDPRLGAGGGEGRDADEVFKVSDQGVEAGVDARAQVGHGDWHGRHHIVIGLEKGRRLSPRPRKPK
jgi:hypothetical protein